MSRQRHTAEHYRHAPADLKVDGFPKDHDPQREGNHGDEVADERGGMAFVADQPVVHDVRDASSQYAQNRDAHKLMDRVFEFVEQTMKFMVQSPMMVSSN